MVQVGTAQYLSHLIIRADGERDMEVKTEIIQVVVRFTTPIIGDHRFKVPQVFNEVVNGAFTDIHFTG